MFKQNSYIVYDNMQVENKRGQSSTLPTCMLEYLT